MNDLLDIPEFLRIPAADRRQAWIDNPPRAIPAFNRPMTDAERERKADELRRASLKRAIDEQRWAGLKAKTASDKAERAAVAAAVKRRKR